MKTKIIVIAAVLLMVSSSFSQINVKFEQFKLDNGLNVIIHEDHSSPVCAILVMYHVGSKNEKPKRTGFAHLFEHVMFKGSAHVADKEHFKLLQEVGANINGFTTEDATTYFEVVPSNYMELGLYLESDRMGFLLDGVTQSKLDNQRDVVKNERRQSYDNQPYGTVDEKILKLIYPPEHPYNWPVIGSMEDLSKASLEDVKAFFRTYYAPNNACVVVAGDIDPAEAKSLVQKYFAEIPRGKDIERPKAIPVTLSAEQQVVFEDSVHLPRLYITWHTTAVYTHDDAVLDVLANILGAGKTSRLYKALVFDKQIAQNLSVGEEGREIDGTFSIDVTAKPRHNLTEIKAVVDSILADVMTNGVTDKEVRNALTAAEVGVVSGAQTELGKAIALARYYSFMGNPDYINHQMDIYKDITPAEVVTIAKKYLTNAKVTFSAVPVGKTDLAVQSGK
jgi:zinc protease